MTRIAVGGFLHETNTFAPTKATFADFQHGGGWPAMTQGADVLKVMRRINVGLAGFVDSAEANSWELIPTIACGASPSAHVCAGKSVSPKAATAPLVPRRSIPRNVGARIHTIGP